MESFDREKFWWAVRINRTNLKQIAESADVSVWTVIRAAKGDWISEYHFDAICAALGVDPNKMRETYFGVLAPED